MEVGIRTFVHGKGGGVDELGPHTIDMNTFAERLNDYYRGFHQDLGGRTLDCWHPNIDKWQSLNFMHQHICSMDRGRAGQWPKWTVIRELVEMPMNEASRYYDPANMPVVSLAPGHHPWEMETPKAVDMGTVYVERPVLDDVDKIGWAEVFWQLCKSCPFVDAQTLGLVFGVPVDWMTELGDSPLNWTFREAAMRGWAVKS